MRTNQVNSYPDVRQSIGMAGIVIAGTLLFTPVSMVLAPVLGREAAALIYYLCAMGSAFVIVSSIRKKKSGAVFFTFRLESPGIVALLLTGGVALSYGIILPITSLLPLPEGLESVFAELLTQQSPFTLILLVIAAPVLEELIFRGIMLEGLLKKYNHAQAVAISSLLFGVVHLNPWQLVAGFILAVFIGWVYCMTRNIFYSIIIHAAANGSGYLIRVWNDPATVVNGSLTELYGGRTQLIMSIGVAILVLSGSVYILHKQFSAAKVKESVL